jgi:hypothetical protein
VIAISEMSHLVKHTRLLHYDHALADGLPIATCVIEGACRYLVQDRMGRTGARWSLVGAEAVLRLRAHRASGDFDDYWQFHLAKEHERNHVSRYAGGQVPNPLPPARPSSGWSSDRILSRRERRKRPTPVRFWVANVVTDRVPHFGDLVKVCDHLFGPPRQSGTSHRVCAAHE